LRWAPLHNKLATMTCRIAALAVLVVLAWTAPVSADTRALPPEIAKLYADKPVIELVTMGVGGLMWERHGHIAICVVYDDRGEKTCYNYGIGDFHHPIGMAAGFFRGTNSFWAGVQSWREIEWIYQSADRTIWVQPLPLTQEQKKKVIDKLEFDVLEANRYYAYDHFWDNCTTRVRDILDDATGGALKAMPEIDDHRTYRDLAREGFLGMRIPLLITDIAMGRVTDRRPTYWERMFLPDYLREAVATKWGIEPIVKYQRRGPPSLKELEKELADKSVPEARHREAQAQYDEIEASPSGRVWFGLLILLLTAPAWATRLWGRFQRTGLAVSLVPQFILGFVLWMLAIISPLPYVRWNETCLVLFPFDLALLFLAPDTQRTYARARVVMLGIVAALMLVGVLKQPLWEVLLWPLVPLAVVGFWPERKAAPIAAAAPEKKSGAAKQPEKRKQKNARR
jgi:hypothetical protein